MTPNTQALQRLLDKVEAGKVSQWFNWNSGIGSHGPLARQAYNGSLDAAKALHEALLPGWRFKIEQHEIVAHGDDFTACVWPND